MTRLYFDVFPTRLGWWGAAATPAGLFALVLPGATPQGAGERLSAEVAVAAKRIGRGCPELQRDPAALAEVREQTEAYATDPATPLTAPLDLAGLSPFAREVTLACRRVAPGQVATYGELAARAGRPGGARAAGQVMGANRLPLFVPCHRVVAAGGGLGGFGGGLAQKIRLLVHEGALAPGALTVGGAPVGDPVERVRRFLRLAGGPSAVLRPETSTRTAVEAAAALGVAPGQIAKSLLFVADRRPVLVVTSGDRRVDQALLRQTVGAERLSLADPRTVQEVTGFAVGGVAPVGHLRPAQVLLDVSMQRFPVVYAAAGTPDSALPVSFPDLVRLSGGEPADICTAERPAGTK